MFYSAGNFEGKILDVLFAESRFSPNDPDAFDVCIHVEGPQCDGKPQDDWWRGEVSAKLGRGNLSNKTQLEITMDALRSIGFEGDDLTRVDQLKGKVIPYKVEAREYEGKTYYDVKYVGGGNFAPKALAVNSVADKLARIRGASPQAPQPSQSAPAQTHQQPASQSPSQEEDLPW